MIEEQGWSYPVIAQRYLPLAHPSLGMPVPDQEENGDDEDEAEEQRPLDDLARARVPEGHKPAILSHEPGRRCRGRQRRRVRLAPEQHARHDEGLSGSRSDCFSRTRYAFGCAISRREVDGGVDYTVDGSG